MLSGGHRLKAGTGIQHHEVAVACRRILARDAAGLPCVLKRRLALGYFRYNSARNDPVSADDIFSGICSLISGWGRARLSGSEAVQ